MSFKSFIIQSYASARDRNPIYSEVSYYGVLREILELDHWVGKKVVLFKCDWVSSGRGLKQDDLGFILVNFAQRLRNKEPFVMASQAQQVFYVQDPIDQDWQVVIKTVSRDFYDMDEEVGDVDTHLQSEICNDSGVIFDDIPNDEAVEWIRASRNGELIDDPTELVGIELVEHQNEATQEEDNDNEVEEDMTTTNNQDAYHY
ncbi:unnamed protein product [Linum trigynum]|uniref:DUF4216 domain-containing protein n=1 Tax=Linum trigynum TaxID=586398 RepID=A0AAV2F937_9ROSI